jgi:hypothetical protein
MNKMRKVLCMVTALLATSLHALAAEWEKPVPADCALVSGGNYYVYGVQQEQFFHPQGVILNLSDEGKPMNFEQQANGDWNLNGPDGFLYIDLDFVGCNGTESDVIAWYVEKQASGSYRLRPSKNDATFPWTEYPDTWTGLSYTTWSITPILKEGEGAIDWHLVAEQDYPLFYSKLTLHRVMIELQGYGYDVSALLQVYNTATDKASFDAAVDSVQDVLDDLRFANATEEHPCDATARYLRNADLTENWVNDGYDVPGWTMVPASFCGMGEFDAPGYYDDNKTLGSWSAGAFGDNKVFQHIETLPNGKYRFGNYGIWIRHTGEDGDPIVGAYIYAKVGSKLFKQPLPDTGWWPGRAEVDFECRVGEAEVGIMFEGTNVGQCVILDFKLEYMGEIPVAERLQTLITRAEELMAEDAINSLYVETLTADIQTARELMTAADAEAEEAHYTKFQADYEDAVYNKECYAALKELLKKAEATLLKGDSEEMGILADYIYENELEDKIDAHAYNNTELDEIIATLTELIEKAANSVVAAGTDVTDLLVNGHFDTTGGWTATLNDFSIDSDKHIMERWWCDWKAEQVVANIPNGTYRLEVQGFQWCSWDWAQAESDWASSDQTPTARVTSKIRLNSDETKIYNVFACGPTDIAEGYHGADYWVPNDANTALQYFAKGLYNNVVETTVTDNTLKVEFDCSSNGFWNIFTNLRLIFVGADMEEAITNLKDAMAQADGCMGQKMQGAIRQALEDALDTATALLDNAQAKYDDINAAATTILTLIEQAKVSIQEYSRLAQALAMAAEALSDPQTAQTEAGQQLQALYNATKADYDSDYPSLDNEGIAATIERIEALISEAKLGSGIHPGDDITTLLANPSFENTYGNDISVGGAAHTVPYGWTMTVEGKDCHTAQELTDAGINSWTAIEDNAYATDGAHSYCLLSAPVPDSYLWQTVSGLPAGTYRVTVDMNVTYDGGCSRLTGQRLLANNVAQYYGKPEYYIASELDRLHPEEVARTFAGYDEVNTNETGAVGDMGNLSTLTVEVTLAPGETLTLGVRTDNNKVAMNRNYEENWWDCTGRYKIDNFRLTCVSVDMTGIMAIEHSPLNSDHSIYDLQGRCVQRSTLKRGLYISSGKKYVK